MKYSQVLTIIVATAIIFFSLNACSDDDKNESAGVIQINGVDHKILEAGYTSSIEHDHICIQFIIEDAIEDAGISYKNSDIEIQIPLSLTERWMNLTEEEPNWRVLLRNVYVGNGTDMGLISDGKVLIRQLGDKDKQNKCDFHVTFEITLTDGTVAVANVRTKFVNYILWVGGC